MRRVGGVEGQDADAHRRKGSRRGRAHDTVHPDLPWRTKLIRVGVVDEHEIFRRGVVTCLMEDPVLMVVAEQARGKLGVEADVAVVSQDAANEGAYACPIVICSDRGHQTGSMGRVSAAAILPRSTLTPDQLIASVRSAAAGLTVGSPEVATAHAKGFEPRSLEVLRLLAEGADTHEISTAVRFSERTVKGIIHHLETELGARTRAQAVAAAIREGLITI